MSDKDVKDSLSKKVDTVLHIIDGRPYLTFRTSEKIEKIVRDMQSYHHGVAGITDATGRFVGILTERDILRKIFGAHGESQSAYDERHYHLSIYPEYLTAWDVMVTNPVCLTEDMPVEQALDVIKQNGFRFMPVVNKNDPQSLTGIVSERELFWHTQEKTRRMLENQSSLLSYMMHHEAYGGAGGFSIDSNFMN